MFSEDCPDCHGTLDGCRACRLGFVRPSHDERLDTAIDAATVACQGLTDRHVVSLAADDARRLAFESTADEARQLRRDVGQKQGRTLVHTTVAILRPVFHSLERRRDAA